MSETKPITGNHIYLYAKNHYERTDLLEDLKVIIGHTYLLDPVFVTKTDVARILLQLTHEYIVQDERSFFDFIKRINPSNLDWYHKMQGVEPPEYDFELSLIQTCLSTLSLLQVRRTKDDGTWEEIINIGEADPEILPYSQDHIKCSLERIEKDLEKINTNKEQLEQKKIFWKKLLKGSKKDQR